MSTKIKNVILLFLFIYCLTGVIQAQEEQPADIYLAFSTWKYSDMSRSLIAKITSDGDKGEYAAEGLPVSFLYVADGEEILIDDVISNEDGLAELNIPDGRIAFAKDAEGYIHFKARFAGNEAYYEAEEELMVKDVSISLAFEEDGEEKMVYFEGVIHGAEEDIPLADDDLYFYVPRMFSDMKIADGWFEEDGTGYIDFPSTIIGDSAGNVLLMARLEDHYDYGNVEVSGTINWALPKVLIQAEGPARELWTPIAPLWMIITLIIMLTGVWGHYIYAMIQLIKIKRSKSQ
ncbi:MAG: hypothetical protein RQ761_02670 [Bacteroidales bacterium]|nr:hypothetical protein [Bacteroidales bacterium]